MVNTMVRKLSSLTKHTAHTTTIIFIIGFIFDVVMLPDIDHLITRYIGLAHICIVAFFIMFREWVISRNTASDFEKRLYSISSFFIAFSSGAALSFIFVYSMRSAEFSASWPLFVMLLICIIANEFVDTHNFRFTLDVGILLIAVLFFIIFNTPLILKVQNDVIFSLSIGISIFVSFIYLYLLQFSSESARAEVPKAYSLALGIPMFVFMLYFLNVIPAVPLSLKSSGVYHSVIRTSDGEFVAVQENDTRILKKYRTSIHHVSLLDDGVYFFSNIDTPAELTAPISHVWEKYDTNTHLWNVITSVSFDIKGGRESGYRAYSKKENIEEGLWRVTVKIGENRVIGREKFEIIKSESVEVKEIKL